MDGTGRPVAQRRLRAWSALFAGVALCGCSQSNDSISPAARISPDRQQLIIEHPGGNAPSVLSLKELPTESSVAPGLFYQPEQFGLNDVSPDGRHVALSVKGHHSMVGLLDVEHKQVREIDLVTEGDVLAFHWTADSLMLVYEIRQASGYQRVKAYDLATAARRPIPLPEGTSAANVTFQGWGVSARQLRLAVTDARTLQQKTVILDLADK